MRKLFYIGFCLTLVMGVGCAITDYALITDNDQTNNNSGASTTGSNVVNTNGKAHIMETSQWAFSFGGGTLEEWIAFVDQDGNGDRVISTYGNNNARGGPSFHDDDYCNPDWNGCAAWTAQDPEVGDADPFDGSQNVNCTLGGSFSILVGSGRLSECGRVGFDGMSVLEKAQLTAQLTPGFHMGDEVLVANFNAGNLSINVDGFNVRTPAFQGIWDGNRGVFDVSNYGFAAAIRNLSEIVPDGTNPYVEVMYKGVMVVKGNGAEFHLSRIADRY